MRHRLEGKGKMGGNNLGGVKKQWGERNMRRRRSQRRIRNDENKGKKEKTRRGASKSRH